MIGLLALVACAGPAPCVDELHLYADELPTELVSVCAGTDDMGIELECPDDTPVVVAGAGIDATILQVDSSESDGTRAQAFVLSGCTLELRDLTISGGYVEQYVDCADGGGSCDGWAGGAFSLDDSTVTLTRVAVRENTADRGGAGALRDSRVVLVDAEVADNRGGGFVLDGESELESVGTSWGSNGDDDVILDGSDFDAGGRTDFVCADSACE
ncbi:MAG: hypothetical protein Q8P41_18970 [Pseudomonadota bacterium]|nr:hypothetical protein [Pseudomonadota bacterium]